MSELRIHWIRLQWQIPFNFGYSAYEQKIQPHIHILCANLIHRHNEI